MRATTCKHCTATHTATHRSTLQHTAAHCNTLQHTATHCNTLQHAATHSLMYVDQDNVRASRVVNFRVAKTTTCMLLFNTLQHAATCCNTLQHAATRCNTLQHTYSFASTETTSERRKADFRAAKTTTGML